MQKGAATRQRILECAILRFAADGFRQASVAGVARDAGITAPAVHAYFGTKEALFNAAFEQDVAGLLEIVKARLGDAGELMPELLAAVDEHPLARRIFQGREADRTAELLALPSVVRTRAELVAMVTAGQQARVLRGDLAPEALAGALETLVLALLLGAVQVGMIGGDERRSAIRDVIVRGVGTGAASAE